MLRGVVILGLCSSFAVVPVLSLLNLTSPAARRPSRPAPPAPVSDEMAALLLSGAAVSVVAPPTGAVTAGTAPAGLAAPASPAAPHSPAVAPISAHAAEQRGVASWLNTIPAGTCANNGAPMGATIVVTSASGASVACRVVSRGPFVSGRIVDLARSTFAALGPASRGLISVSVAW